MEEEMSAMGSGHSDGERGLRQRRARLASGAEPAARFGLRLEARRGQNATKSLCPSRGARIRCGHMSPRALGRPLLRRRDSGEPWVLDNLGFDSNHDRALETQLHLQRRLHNLSCLFQKRKLRSSVKHITPHTATCAPDITPLKGVTKARLAFEER